MLPELRTERLILRPAAAADLDALRAIWIDPDVRRFLFDDVPVARKRATEMLASFDALASDGLGLWTLRPIPFFDPDAAASAGALTLLGCVGLFPVATTAEHEPRLTGAVEPLVALVPAVWHRGFATEALNTVLAYAFTTLRLARLVASVDEPNAASHRLMRRLGFERLSETAGPRYRLVHYTLDAPPCRRR